MRNTLQYIFENYLNAKFESIKGHLVAKFLSNNTVENFMETGIINEDKYLVSGSAGKGQWAEIPWIGIFDKEISVSATRGYDIVYLFRSDMKGVYLSLNQGWTYFKDKYKRKLGKEKILKVAKMWQVRLQSVLNEFSFDSIDLESVNKNSDLPEGYELGHICGKYYSADNLPSEKELRIDLQNMLALFRELKGNMINLSIEDTNNDLLASYDIKNFPKDKKNKSKSTTAINSIIEDEGIGTILEFLPKTIDEVGENKESDHKSKKSEQLDYIEKTKEQQKLGLAGEYMVLQYEKEQLKKYGIDKEIIHVSKDEGDDKGYDIRSYDSNGNEIYIEVKTTTGNSNQPFYITDNEVKFSRANKENYYLYRVFNFASVEKKGEFYILHGEIDKLVELEPKNYIAKAIKPRAIINE